MMNDVAIFLCKFPKKTFKEEADLFKIILNWVNQGKSEWKAGFAKLFDNVRISFQSRDCLEDVVTNEIVRDSTVC